MSADTDRATASDSGARLIRRLRKSGKDALASRSADKLASLLTNGSWIYGAGNYGQLIYGLLTAHNFPVHGFIDQRAADPLLRAKASVPIYEPESAANLGDATLVIAIHNFATDQVPVVEWARRCGFDDILIPAELPDVLGPEASSYWLTGRRFAMDHAASIAHLASLLADQRSVDVLDGVASFRVTGDLDHHPPSDLASQYFPPDIPMPSEPLRLVDGGAYTGDSLAAAHAANLRIDAWYAFEPDPENFRKLARSAASASASEALLFPCGLSNTLGQLRFSTGGTAGSRITDEGDSVVQVVSLDDVLHGIDPNFIKLDVEGSEREALAGMQNTLARTQPNLAISVYHKPQDLWEIPLAVHDLLPDHALYLRQHGYNGFDTVLYAVPTRHSDR